jgi:hypothetical protein
VDRVPSGREVVRELGPAPVLQDQARFPWSRSRSGAKITSVLEEGLPFDNRVWFSDARSPVRRMAVSAHPDVGILVLSLWQGDRCTGTFRLPMREGARVVSTLAHGMAAGLREPSDPLTNSDLWLRTPSPSAAG